MIFNNNNRLDPWLPLKGAIPADSLLPLVNLIADALWDGRDELDPSLSEGLPGLALLLGYLSASGDRERRLVQAQQCLGLAIQRIEGASGSSLHDGYVGVAWAVEHLQRRFFGGDGEDLNSDVDEMLLETLDHSPWRGHFDLMGGLTGIGIYALERLPAEGGKAVLGGVVRQLEARSLRMEGGGIAWPTPPELLPEWQRELSPEGCFNMGTAHGIPAVLPVLAAAVAFGVEAERSHRLLVGGVEWLKSQFQRPSEGCYLPERIILGEPQPERTLSRIAWCYGDLGASLALLQAARFMDEPAWEALAVSMGHLAADRPLTEAGMKDASVCHGSAGNAHLFHRLYRATGDPRFLEASLAYLGHALESDLPGEGFPGFRRLVQALASGDAGREMASTLCLKNPGLLQGAAGAALSLLAFLGGPEPAWDRHLAASLPLPSK